MITASTRELILQRAQEIQREEIERNLRRLRYGQLIQDMKFCPLCVPQLFDASLEFTPSPLYCREHATHFLARCGLEVCRDRGGFARPQFEMEARQCA